MIGKGVTNMRHHEENKDKKYYVWVVSLIITLLVGMNLSPAWMVFTCIGITCVLRYYDKKINKILTDITIKKYDSKYVNESISLKNVGGHDFFRGCKTIDNVEERYSKLKVVYADNEEILSLLSRQYQEYKKIVK